MVDASDGALPGPGHLYDSIAFSLWKGPPPAEKKFLHPPLDRGEHHQQLCAPGAAGRHCQHGRRHQFKPLPLFYHPAAGAGHPRGGGPEQAGPQREKGQQHRRPRPFQGPGLSGGGDGVHHPPGAGPGGGGRCGPLRPGRGRWPKTPAAALPLIRGCPPRGPPRLSPGSALPARQTQSRTPAGCPADRGGGGPGPARRPGPAACPRG